MGRSIKISIGELEFKSKSSAIKFFMEILHKYKKLGGKILEEHNYMIGLIENHRDSKEKIGCGISHFFVAQPPDGFKTQACFYLKRTDGSSTEFSYPKIINGHPDDRWSMFREACRYSVTDYLISVKNNMKDNNRFCHLTGKALGRKDCMLRHGKPIFNQIVKDFVKDEEINWKQVELSHDADNQAVYKIVNKEISKKFIEFHEENSRLFLIDKNLTGNFGRLLKLNLIE